MDCLRSFNLSINENRTYAAPVIKSWANGVQNYFIVEDGVFPNISTFNISGFKNINLFGVSVVGGVFPSVLPLTNSGVIEDWTFTIFLGGQLPIISGNTTTNYFNIDSNANKNNTIYLSQNTNTIMFASPFQSVKFIDFTKMRIQGHGLQTLGALSAEFDFNFTFYYKFEGE
jgi:hypothetical protein